MLTSRLDTDFYILTMGQVIWKYWRDYEVSYSFKNRSLGVRLGDEIDLAVLRSAVEEYRKLTFTEDDLAYLGKLGIFSDGYIEFLRHTELPEVKIRKDAEGWLHIDYSGRWADAVFWEVPLLSMVNQTYFYNKIDRRIGMKRLVQKINVLRDHSGIKFSEFGTRRRASFAWQGAVLEVLLNDIDEQMVSTSNPYWARQFDIPVVGTMAHQLFMVIGARRVAYGGSPFPLARAETDVLSLWHQIYQEHPNMLIGLTDTFGSAHFLTYQKDFLKHLSGLRQDSGDPHAIGEMFIRAWNKAHIKPTEQKLLFSDGLDVNTMLSLFYSFGDRTQVGFGWGTDLTNDCSASPLNIVIKPASVDGNPTVKLSDTVTKATGDRDDVERYKELSQYQQLVI